MKLKKVLGAGLAATLAFGGMAAVPVAAAPRAEAAIAAPVVTTAVKAPRVDLSRWFDKNHWPTRTAALGKTVSFTVKATGGSLKYQWYYKNPTGGKSYKVSGKSAKTKTLKIKVTSKTRGKLYYAVVANSKGKAGSGMFVLFQKRGKVSKTRYAQAGTVGKFLVTPWGRTSFQYGSTGTSVVVQNISKSNAKPGSTLRFAYRAPNGKLYPNQNRNWSSAGKKSVTLKPNGYFQVNYLRSGVPASAKGGHWVVWSTSDPSRKMAILSPKF